MKRRWVYPGEIPRTLDILTIQRNALIAVSQLAMDILRNNVDPENNTYPTLLAGFKPAFPGGMNITIGDGRLYTVDAVDTVAMGDAGVDATQVLQQAQHTSTVLAFGAAPANPGESRIDIVQVKRQEYDGNNAVLLYYNSTPPYTPWLGAANNGIAQAQDREQKVLISVKAGVAGVAPVAPAADAGYTVAFQVTIANGTVALAAGNIAPPSPNPFIAGLTTSHHGGTAGSAPKIDPATEIAGTLTSNLINQGAALPAGPFTSAIRGLPFLLQGAAGVPDKYYIGMKLGDDSYNYVEVSV